MWVLAARRLGETEIPRGLRLEHGDWHTRHEPRKKAGARMVALKLRALDGSGDSHPEMLCELVVLIPVMPFDTCDDMHSPPEAILISATVAASADVTASC